MRIDSHHHLWNYDPVRHAWITPEMQTIRRDFGAQDLRPVLERHQIDGTIVVQVDQSERENQFLLDLADQNDWIRGVVGWVDLRSPDVATRLGYFSTYPKVCGFRHLVQDEPDENFLLGESFQKGIGVLKDFGFTYDILVFSNQLPAAIKLAQAHPEQTFVLDHIAKPYIKDKKISPWDSDIRELAKSPNVWCKISGMITEADHRTWEPDDLIPYLDIVFEAFGEDRLMYGSDWPVCLLAGSYDQVIAIIENYVKDLSEDSHNKIFGANALQAYGISGELVSNA